MTLDFLGHTIHAGDTIVYPWRQGSTMSLKKLVVTQVTEEYLRGYNSLGRLVKLKTFKNMVVVPTQPH